MLEVHGIMNDPFLAGSLGVNLFPKVNLGSRPLISMRYASHKKNEEKE
jgi:hypothetical protein